MAEHLEVPAGAEHVPKHRVQEHVEGVEGGEAEAAGESRRVVVGLAHLDHVMHDALVVAVELAADRVGGDVDALGDAEAVDVVAGGVGGLAAVGVAGTKRELPAQRPRTGLEVAAQQRVAEQALLALVDRELGLDLDGGAAGIGLAHADVLVGEAARGGHGLDLVAGGVGVQPADLGVGDREAAVAIAVDDDLLDLAIEARADRDAAVAVAGAAQGGLEEDPARAPVAVGVDRQVGDVAVAGDRDVEVADLLAAPRGEHARAGLDGDAHVEVGASSGQQLAQAGRVEVAGGPRGAGLPAQDRGDVDLGVLARAVEALGPEGDAEAGARAQVAAVLVALEQRAEVVDHVGLGEAAATLELALAVEVAADVVGDFGRHAAGDALIEAADLDDRALLDLEVERAGSVVAELLVAAAHAGQQEALALIVGAQVGGLAHGGLVARGLAALEQLHLCAQPEVGVAAVAEEVGLDAAAEVDAHLE